MRQKPRNPKESFFARGAGVRAILGGVLIGLLTLAAFYCGLWEHNYPLGVIITDLDNPQYANVLTYSRTMAFVVLAASQLFYSLSMRSETKSIFQVGVFKNKYLIGSIIVGLLLQLAVISVPFLAKGFQVQNLSLKDWGLVMVFAIIPLLVNEIIKLFIRLLSD